MEAGELKAPSDEELESLVTDACNEVRTVHLREEDGGPKCMMCQFASKLLVSDAWKNFMLEQVGYDPMLAASLVMSSTDHAVHIMEELSSMCMVSFYLGAIYGKRVAVPLPEL